MSATPATQVAEILNEPAANPPAPATPPAAPSSAPPVEDPPAPLSLSPGPPAPPAAEPQPGPPSSSPQPSAPPQPSSDPNQAIEALFDKHFPEPTDPTAKPDWKKWKESMLPVINENRTMTVEMEELRKGGQGDDALKQQLEQANNRLKELEPLESEVTELRSIRGIEDSPAFREKYDEGRVSIQENFTRLAQEAGISKEDAEAVLNSSSEIQAATALSKIDGLEDAAKSILLPLASQFVVLTRERAAQLKPEDPSAALKSWQERSQQQQGQALSEIRQRGVQAADEAIQGLADDPMMKTEAGKQKVAGFRQRIEQNDPVTETEAYELMLKGEFAEDWREFGMSQFSRVRELESEIARLKGLQPGSATPPPPGGGSRQTPVYTGSAPPEPDRPAPIKIG